ncbi:PAS domain S-box-containing protein [Nocardioides scoriae]|uniref:PAS domain S-box-containing protein n=1 Tax=Nocardioides scoriae TaxID=642780 RepID=A0A1H1XHS9_9ACTN|nr:PAS domain-containing protein [Nocardioides scoriae]SDT08784.1 PAS domain S-box-containing protein [Nocardioides scoriae]
MSAGPGPAHDEPDLEELRQQVAYLQRSLAAIGGGAGVDAVVLGEEDHEQVYTLTSADRPYRVIVENMGEGAVTVSENGVVLYANPQIADFLGVDRNSMAGRDITDYVSMEQLPVLADLLMGRETGTRRAELTVPRSDGSEVPTLVAATDLDVEGVTVRCLVFTDLTMQKLVEQKVADDSARAERMLVAAEVNDTIVQGLVAAEMALDLGQTDFARSLVARTSSHARHWIGELAGGQSVEPGTAVRRAPARTGTETP